MDFFRQYSSTLIIQYAHNCYLQILAETGLIGLMTFLWFLFELIRNGYKKIKTNNDLISLGLFTGFLAFLIHMFFDTQMYSLKLSMLFWILAAFLETYSDKKIPK
jgi:putative inorganic carbon (hco3(-)) transporter